MHQEATKPNWTMVSVTGLGNALRILLDEVLERALVRYLYGCIERNAKRLKKRAKENHQ